MRIAEIYLPNTHERHIEAHAWIRTSLIDAWGGFTMLHAFGAWRDHGADVGQERDITECVSVYRVAMLEHEAEAAKLRAIAAEVCGMADQACVMYVTTSGRVYFVDRKGETYHG